METALRKHHNVITYGPSVNDDSFETDVIKAWNLESIQHRIWKHDIPLFSTDLGDVFQRLPSGWHPDLFLWVETGLNFHMKGIEDLPCLSACYFIDTNFHFEQHVRIAKRFNLLFVALRPYVSRFQDRGIDNVFWVPVACDPAIHGKKSDQKLYDIGFVGTLTNSKRRTQLIDTIKSRFHFYYERCFLERMAEVFSQSKIVFNVQPTNGLNMRVFEAMASGSMLLTDEAEGSGLSNLFEDRRHLVLYRNSAELLDLVEYYLRNHDEREKIGQQGMEEVLARHTYEHRIKEMTAIAASFLGKNRRPVHDEDKPTLTPPSQENKEAYDLHQMNWIAGFVPYDAERILDVGCKDGFLGRKLMDAGAKEVFGIESETALCAKARANLTHVIRGDIEHLKMPFEKRYFDCIVFSDTLEHLKDPLSVVKRLKTYLSEQGVIVACIPNVRYWGVISMILDGHWRYHDYGILDRNHLRFSTKKEIALLFKRAGLRITAMEENLDERYQGVHDLDSGEISFGRVTLKGLTADDIRELFVTRYLVAAKM